MYRLMKFEKFTHDHVISGPMPLYRQIQLNQFRRFRAVLTACAVANNKGGSCHYVLIELHHISEQDAACS